MARRSSPLLRPVVVENEEPRSFCLALGDKFGRSAIKDEMEFVSPERLALDGFGSDLVERFEDWGFFVDSDLAVGFGGGFR